MGAGTNAQHMRTANGIAQRFRRQGRSVGDNIFVPGGLEDLARAGVDVLEQDDACHQSNSNWGKIHCERF